MGQNIGAGRPDRAEAAARLSAWLAFGTSTAVGLAQMPLAPDIMAALAPGQTDVIAGASRFAYAYLPFLGVNALTQVLLGTFRGAGSASQSMALAITQQCLFQLPFAWAGALLTPLGLSAVWWCYLSGGVASVLLCGW